MILMFVTSVFEVVGCIFVSYIGVLMYGIKIKFSDIVIVRKVIVKVRFYRNFEDELYELKLFWCVYKEFCFFVVILWVW